MTSDPRGSRETMRQLQYVRANLKLRDMYGIELTRQEWEQVSALFRNNKVMDAKSNSIGDVQGYVWLKGGTPCYAVYSVRHGAVVAWYPTAPPVPATQPFPTKKSDKPPETPREQPAIVLRHVAVDGEAHRPTATPIVDGLTEELAKARLKIESLGKELWAQQKRNADIRWWKRQIADACVLWDASPRRAIALLRAVASLKRDFSPSTDLAETQRLVDAAVGDDALWEETRRLADGAE